MLPIIIAIPLGEPGSIEIRPAGIPEGMDAAPLRAEVVVLNVLTTDFLEVPATALAERYAAPAFAALQNKLRERGF